MGAEPSLKAAKTTIPFANDGSDSKPVKKVGFADDLTPGPDQGVEQDSMSDEEWGTKSDTDMIKNIKDKARAESPLGLFENFRKSKTTATEAAKEAAGAIEHMATSKWDNMSRASEDNDAVLDKASIMTKEKRATTSIAEEAVLKMVANIDKTAVSAECM